MGTGKQIKVGVMQPYFMPYIGYFQLIKAVDKYVIFDDVNFIKRGWAARNNILINGNKHLFSIQLDGASQNKLFNDIYISDDFSKLRKTLDMAYHKAPYYSQAMPLIEEILNYDNKNLSSFIANSIIRINEYLNINTDILFSSQIEKDNNLKGQDKIISICKTLNATHYYNAIGGMELYDRETWADNGMILNFVSPVLEPYQQFKSAEFIPGLSIIDVIMNCSIEKTNQLLDKFELL